METKIDPMTSMAPPDPTWNPPPPAAVPPNVAVSAPEPSPVETMQPSFNAMIPSEVETMQPDFGGTIPSETAPNNPDIERHYHEATWRKILDKVGGILGGDTTIHVTKDKDGNVSVTHDPSTSGEKWSRIAATALGGAAQGIANSRGPGGNFRAAAAGTQFGLQENQRREDDANKQATVEQRRQQLNASNVLTHQRILQNTMEAERNGLEISKESADVLNNALQELKSSPYSQDFGPVKNVDDVIRKTNENADYMKSHGDLSMKVVPMKGPNGWESHAIATDAGDDAQPVAKGATVHRIKVDPATGKSTLYEEPVSDTRMTKGKLRITNSVVDAEFMKQSNDWTKAHAKDNPVPKNPTEASLAYDAESNPDPEKRRIARASLDLLQKLKEDKGSAGAGLPGGSIDENAAMMVDGLSAPSQMSKRASYYNELLPRAQAYSLKKYGQPFDAEISEARYKARSEVLQQFAGGKPADQIQSFQAFTNHAQSLMDDVAKFRTTNIKLVNMPFNKLRTLAGNADVTAVETHVQALRREYLNFLSNNMALKEGEIKEGNAIMENSSSPAQIEEAVKAFMTTAIGRVSALNNRAQRFDVPIGGEILTPQNRQTINSLGLGDYANQLIKPPQAAPQMFNGGRQQQPTPGGQGIPEPIAPARPQPIPGTMVTNGVSTPVNVTSQGIQPAPGDAGKGTSAPPTDGGGQAWDANIWRNSNKGKDIKPMIKWAKEHNFKVINE